MQKKDCFYIGSIFKLHGYKGKIILFNENDMKMIYCTFNSHPNASVYLFCIATKNESKWVNKIPFQISHEDPFPGGNHQNWVGCHAINTNSRKNLISRFVDKFFKWK